MIKIRITGSVEDIEKVIDYLKKADFITMNGDKKEDELSRYYPSSGYMKNYYADFLTEEDLRNKAVVGGVLQDYQIINYIKINGSSDTAALLRYFNVEYDQIKEQLDNLVNTKYLERTLYGGRGHHSGRYVYELGPRSLSGFTHTDICLYQEERPDKKCFCHKFGRIIKNLELCDDLECSYLVKPDD